MQPRQNSCILSDYRPIMTENVASRPMVSADGRQSEAALAIRHGVQRLLAGLGIASLPEVTLPNGRRADVVGIAPGGQLWLIEIKSSVADFRADAKWPDYQDFADRLMFAVAADFPLDLIPQDVGLIVADRYGGEVLREAPALPLSAARRKSLHLRLARLAAARLHSASDPELRLETFRID
jgi:hypothetical protein